MMLGAGWELNRAWWLARRFLLVLIEVTTWDEVWDRIDNSLKC